MYNNIIQNDCTKMSAQNLNKTNFYSSTTADHLANPPSGSGFPISDFLILFEVYCLGARIMDPYSRIPPATTIDLILLYSFSGNTILAFLVVVLFFLLSLS